MFWLVAVSSIPSQGAPATLLPELAHNTLLWCEIVVTNDDKCWRTATRQFQDMANLIPNAFLATAIAVEIGDSDWGHSFSVNCVHCRSPGIIVVRVPHSLLGNSRVSHNHTGDCLWLRRETCWFHAATSIKAGIAKCAMWASCWVQMSTSCFCRRSKKVCGAF